MPTPNGMIIVTKHRTVAGQMERLDYRWQGGPIVAISMWLGMDLRLPRTIGARFTVGPYRLRVLDYLPMRGDIIAIRSDRWYYRLAYLWHRGNHWLDVCYRRLILTAEVWGLARCDPAVIPSWRDLRLARGKR